MLVLVECYAESGEVGGINGTLESGEGGREDK